MPNVPRLEGPSVRTQLVRTPTAGPGAAGTDVAASAAAGIAKGLDIIDREIQAADQVRAQAAEVKLLGERDAIVGELEQTFGEETLKFQDQAQGRWQQRVSALESTLATPEQKEMFRLRAASHGQALARAVDGRVQQTVRAMDKQDTDVLTMRKMEELANASGDLPAASRMIEEMLDLIRGFGSRPHNEMTPLAVEQAVTEARSKARALQVAQLLASPAATDWDKARQVLAQHGDELLAADRDTLTPKVSERDERAKVDAVAEAVLSRAKTKEEAETLLAEIPIALRREVRKVVNGEFDAREAARKEAEDQIYRDAAARVRDAGPGVTVRELLRDVWPDLTPERRASLEALGEAPIQNDGKAWMTFFHMSPEQVAKLSEADFETLYWSRFDAAHRSDAERIYKAARKDPTGQSREQSFMVPLKEQVENAARLAGFIPLDQSIGSLGAADRKRFIQFQDAVYRLVRETAAELEAKGIAVTPDHIDAIVTSQSLRQLYNVDRTGPDREDVMQFELSADDRGNAYVPRERIDAEDWVKLKNEALSEGVNIGNDAYSRRVLERLRAADLLGDEQLKSKILEDARARGGR